MSKKTFTIIGLGLMGSSLGMAMKRHFKGTRVIGLSRSLKKAREAKRFGICDQATTNLKQAVGKADLVVICTPPKRVPSMVKQIDAVAPQGCIVTDVASTKSALLKDVRAQRPKRIQFVGSHPIAGSDQSGMHARDPHLFRGALTFVIQDRATNKQAIRTVSKLWRDLEGRVRILTPGEHDEIVAAVSHLPHAVTAVLVDLISTDRLKCAGSGFRDLTRIAKSDPKLWLEIFQTNQKPLLAKLRKFKAQLERFIRTLEKGEWRRIETILKEAVRKRRSLES